MACDDLHAMSRSLVNSLSQIARGPTVRVTVQTEACIQDFNFWGSDAWIHSNISRFTPYSIFRLFDLDKKSPRLNKWTFLVLNSFLTWPRAVARHLVPDPDVLCTLQTLLRLIV